MQMRYTNCDVQSGLYTKPSRTTSRRGVKTFIVRPKQCFKHSLHKIDTFNVAHTKDSLSYFPVFRFRPQAMLSAPNSGILFIEIFFFFPVNVSSKTPSVSFKIKGPYWQDLDKILRIEACSFHSVTVCMLYLTKRSCSISHSHLPWLKILPVCRCPYNFLQWRWQWTPRYPNNTVTFMGICR